MRTALGLMLALTALTAAGDYMDHFVIREDVGIHKAPYLGPAELVVIPIEVATGPPMDTDALAAFFAPDNNDGFVHYYRTASLGRYQPHVTVAPKVLYPSCPLPPDQFPTCSVARGDIAAFTAGLDMIRDVVRRERDENGFDFSKLDVNGRNGTPDGWADGVMLLTNVDFGGIAFPFGYYNRGDNLDGGMGGPLIVNGVKIGHVAIAGNNEWIVLVHEFGHVLGLTDLYSESPVYDGLWLSQMGAWGYDKKIPLPDAESRFRLRWDNWHQVSGKQRVRIHPVETLGEVWRLGVGDEYFLVENRGPGDFDQFLTGRGLAVFHVDRTLKQLNGQEGRFQDRILNCVDCDPWHPYIGWVQADGTFRIENNQRPDYPNMLFLPGDSLHPDPSGQAPSASHPVLSSNFYSGQSSGISISDIKLETDGTFEVTLEGPKGCDEQLCASGDGCQPETCSDPKDWNAGGCSTGAGLVPFGLILLLRALCRGAPGSRLQVRASRGALESA